MIHLYRPDEIERLRQSGIILSSAFERLQHMAKPGVSLTDLDDALFDFLDSQQAVPSFLGYRNFPASCCTSINEEVLHGIPSPRTLSSGDIFKLDIGVRFRELCTDRADTWLIGQTSDTAVRLKQCAEQALEAGIKMCRSGRRLGDVGAAIEETAASYGFSLIEGYTGHGVGRLVHEEPTVANNGKYGEGIEIKAGMVLALEPMVAEGKGKVVIAGDGWTVSTRDGSLTAHAEHTVLVTSGEPEVLTR